MGYKKNNYKLEHIHSLLPLPNQTFPLSSDHSDPGKQTGLQKKYFKAWRVSKKSVGDLEEVEEQDGKESSEEEKSPQKVHHVEEKDDEAEEPKWKIALKSLAFLTIGVGLVSRPVAHLGPDYTYVCTVAHLV